MIDGREGVTGGFNPRVWDAPVAACGNLVAVTVGFDVAPGILQKARPLTRVVFVVDLWIEDIRVLSMKDK